MLLDLLRFEWRYQTHRLTFLAVAACFALVGFGLAATAFGPNDIHLNSPYSIAESVGLASLVAVLAATFFCAHGALRDSEHHMTEIVYATAITKRQYVFGRYVGIAAAAVTAFAFVVPGLLAGTFAVAHEPQRVGAFRALPYVIAGLVIALPNLLLITALLFAISLLTRSSLATYVGGVLAYGVYFVAMLFSGSPLMASSSPPTARGMAIAALADPFGLSAFFEQTRYWTVPEREARLLDLSGHLLANRLLWLVATCVLLAAVYRRFAFRIASPSEGGLIVRRFSVTPDENRRPIRPPSRAPLVQGSAFHALVSATRFEVRHALRSWPLVALLIGWIATSMIELTQTFRFGEFGTAVYPTTGLILGELRLPLSLFGLLMLFYYAAELVWRERSAGMNEIVDATPVPSGVLLTSKIAALGVLLALLITVASLGAMAFQLLSGWTRLEPSLYASLFLFTGLPLLYVAILAVLVQSLVPNRYLGILLTALLTIYWHRGAVGGPDHPLLRFAAAPEVPYSDLAGFGPETLSFAWFSAYWGAFVLILLALGTRWWKRGNARASRLSRPARLLIVAATLAWLVLGALIFVQTNRWNAYRTAEEVESWRARYERAYRHLENAPQPSLADVRIDVDLHPEERRYEVRGRYVLENRTSVPIDTLVVTTRRDLARADVRVAGHGPAERDANFGTSSFELHPPLGPGQRTSLDFEVAIVRRGAVAGNADRGIVRNGSFLLSPFSLPTLGYRRTYELADPEARRRQGLPPRTQVATLEVADAAELGGGAPVPLTFETTLTTSPGQIALAPGALVESGMRNGRRFFRYRNEHTTSPYAAFTSGRYAIARRMHDGISLEVYYHPTHGRNVEAILDAASRALDYCRTAYGPYPHRELRIVEVPSSWANFSGFAMPGLIFMLEDRGFLTDRSDPGRVDVVTKRIAHEVAHQWWGYQASPAPQPGAAAIVETLARYTELRVLAAMHGEAAVPAALEFEHDRYLSGRTGGDEPPLDAVQNQAYVYYSKGALVMSAIRDLIGEPATNAALRRLLADSQPTADGLLAHLQREAPEKDRALIGEWWRGIVLYDLRITDAHLTPRGQLQVRIDARKTDRNAMQPMDEELELGVYADDRGSAPLQVVRCRVRGTETITLDVDPRARYVVIDPNILRIDRNRADNGRAIARSGN